ncbi:MAG: domain 2, partial [Verrucomicrobiota bacterium]
MQIYISQDGRRIGPFAVEEINRQLAAGQLAPSDLGWSESSPGWKPLLSFAGVIV